LNRFIIGQRWISEMELKLGLGIVKEIDGRTVKIFFPASDCSRLYAISSAPLKRVEFLAGDIIQSRQGLSFKIDSVSTKDGIFIYHSSDIDLPETEINDTISFTTPKDRLANRSVDHNDDFNIRYRSLLLQHRIRQSPVRGFVGGRMDLIPHQLYVVNEITSRYIPRVLLSDETGLGKTIEACLVLHRLILSERIDRVLILVPQSLVNQWFVELLRRFNLIVRIFDEELKESMTNYDSHENPFLEDQLCISSIDFLTSDKEWKKLAIKAEWDMVIIDEAHHLLEDSPQYRLAKDLSEKTTGLMLLTATPEQFGHRSHFSRLHLLDPARYYDFNLFEKEEEQYEKISGIINSLMKNGRLNKTELKSLEAISPNLLSDIKEGIVHYPEKKEDLRQFIEYLLDRFGTGRAVFRNNRSGMKGFPKRQGFLIPLECTEEDLKNQRIEFGMDNNIDNVKNNINYKKDPRITWLVSFLKKHSEKKILLICHSKEKVTAIKEILKKLISIDITLFHEDLNLLQRDRNAAWFAEEDGPQMLISSEIGSEGRNFQFAHDLVLFDLPLDPELLEQRIGRLDRIGQSSTINIHVPFLLGSEQEILARWYHQGLNAFSVNVPGVYQVYQKLNKELMEILMKREFPLLKKFIETSQELVADVSKKTHEGRDHLLELNSFRPEVAKSIINEIKAIDEEKELEDFMLKVFDLYDIQEDYLSEKTYRLNLTLLSTTEFPLPVLRRDDLKITFDRKTALLNEDIEFLSWDHPMVYGILELILGTEKGNCTAALWHDAKNQEILLEAIFVLESIAPKNLYIDRFLPPTPIRVMVNHSLEDCGKKYPVNICNEHLENYDEPTILDTPKIKQEVLPKMVEASYEIANNSADEIKSRGLNNIISSLNKELNRLKELKKMNNNIKEEEILSCEGDMELLKSTIESSRLRLDSLRFIYKGDIE